MNRRKKKPTPKYVESNRGRYYFRRSRAAARVRLPDDPNSPEFLEAHARLVIGLPIDAPAPSRRSKTKTLDWLIKLYLQSPEFKAYKPQTQATRRRQLERLGEKSGTRELGGIDRAVIKACMTARQDKIAAANAWLTTVSNMFKWAGGEYQTDPKTGETTLIVEVNPCEFVKRFQEARSKDLDEDDGIPPWTREQEAAFEAAYDHGTRQRLIYEVAHETGMRAGDLARVGRQHVGKDDVIRLKTEKTGTWVYVVVTPRLKNALELGPKGREGELALITGLNGKAMQKGYLGDFLSTAAKKIDIDRSAHGLRKSAAIRCAEEGKSANELMAIFGWTTIDMAEKYTRMFDRERTAIRAQRAGQIPSSQFN
jgi:integrase